MKARTKLWQKEIETGGHIYLGLEIEMNAHVQLPFSSQSRTQLMEWCLPHLE